jgi:hypothetical protein
MEPVQNRALADTIRTLAAKLPVNRDATQVRADEVKAKIDAAASDGAVISAFSRDYQSDIT